MENQAFHGKVYVTFFSHKGGYMKKIILSTAAAALAFGIASACSMAADPPPVGPPVDVVGDPPPVRPPFVLFGDLPQDQTPVEDVGGLSQDQPPAEGAVVPPGVPPQDQPPAEGQPLVRPPFILFDGTQPPAEGGQSPQ